MSDDGQRKRSARRGNNEGTVYWREDRQRWVADYIFHRGTPNRKKVTKTFKTQKEATQFLGQMRRSAEESLPTPDARYTVAKLADYWAEQVVTPSALAIKTKESYFETVSLHVKPSLGHLRLNALRYESLHGFIMKKRDEGYSRSSMNTMMVVLRGILDQGIRMGKLSRNLARLVPLPEPLIATKEVKGWNLVDAHIFLDAAAETDQHVLFVVTTMIGLRRGEALAMEWRDIDFETGTFHLRRQVQRIKGHRCRLPALRDHPVAMRMGPP